MSVPDTRPRGTNADRSWLWNRDLWSRFSCPMRKLMVLQNLLRP